jgi:chromosome segregation ATPase
MIDHNELRAECKAQVGFEDGTAYFRTKVCCRILMRNGEAIPSWMVIRDIIGKGSSGDINRAIKDFRREHAERLRLMEGSVPGLPEHLAPLVSSLWESAVAAARAEFAANEQRWQGEIERAEQRSDQLAQQLADAKLASDRQLAQIEALEAQVRTERAAREQAERLFEQHAADMSAQRDKLETALRENQAEMQKALDRLDGERRHALLQIDEARTKAANDLAAERSRGAREKAVQEQEIVRLGNSVSDLRRSLNEADRKVAVKTQEVFDLRERLSHAEINSARLSEDNRRMVGLIKSGSNTVHTNRLRNPQTLIAKRLKKKS